MSIEYVVMLWFCLVIVGILLLKAISDKNLDKYQKNLLILVLSAQSLMIVSESLGVLMSLDRIQTPDLLNAFVQFIFFLSQSITIFTTFLLLAVITGYITLKNKKARILFAIPACITILLAFISIWSGWLFYIDENGFYQQGPINFIQYVIVAFYIGFAGISAIVKMFMRKYYARRSIYITIFIYSFIPLIGTILQHTVYNITGVLYPFILASFTVSTLIIYLQLMQNQVQTDALTEIPNRAKFMRYLESKMDHEANDLYLFILDINGFKNINDSFGHVEGDRALKALSSSLRNFSKATGNFVARYAGDEFVIVVELKKQDLQEVIDLIHKHIEYANEELNDDRYKLSLSVGYALYDNSMQSCIDFIQKADKEMYKEKEKYHNSIK